MSTQRRFTTEAPIMGTPSTMNDSYQFNIRKLFERGCLLQPTSEIVTKLQNGTSRIKYIDLQKRATKIASLLKHNYNIKIGDRIGTFMWTNIEQMLLLFAVPSMGAILNPINFRLHSTDLSYTIQHTQHKVMFIDHDLIPLFNKIPSKALQTITHFIICRNRNHDPNGKNVLQNVNIHSQTIIYFDQFENETPKHSNFIWPNMDERSGATLLYTSGTTGHPKATLYSHRSLYIHMLNLAMTDSFNISGTDCVLTMVSLCHVLSTLMPLLAMMLGFKLLLLGRCNDYNEILSFCVNEGCTVINGVPIHLESFRHSLQLNAEKYKGIRGVLTRAIVGGSKPHSNLIQWFWDQYRVEVIHSWGMSETEGISFISRRCCRRNDLLLDDSQKLRNLFVAGLPLPSIHGKTVAIKDKMGQFYVNGPIATTKYYNIELNDKFDESGWLNTGDIVSVTDKQQIVINDRSKDMIKSGGEWISSQDMESFITLKFADEIEKVCVIGVYHHRYEERPIAIVQLSQDEKVENVNVFKQDIIQHLQAKYANFQLPDDILFWKMIPVTGTSKISKKDVRARLKKEKYRLPRIPLRKMVVMKNSDMKSKL